MLRLTGNLKLTQQALNHCNIRITLRYAHVLDGEVKDALERVAEPRNVSRAALKRVGWFRDIMLSYSKL